MNITPQELAEGAKRQYQELLPARKPFEDRALLFSKLTLPYIFPDASADTGNENFKVGYSSEGAVGVSNLANKYINRMFPHYSYFKITIPDEVMLASGKPADFWLRAAVAKEKEAMKHLQGIGARSDFIENVLNLIITGNYLLHKAEDGDKEFIGYPLDKYVLQRDQRGRMITCIAKDTTYLRAMPADVQTAVINELQITKDEVYDKVIDLYTRIEFVEDKYIITKSAENVDLGDYKEVKPEKLRWEPLVWHRYRKDAYGRGLVEDVFSEIHGHDVAREVMLTAGAVAADIKILVSRAAGVNVDELNSSASGTYHLANDVNGYAVIQMNKTQDIQIMQALAEETKRNISQVFMRLAGSIRDSERTTAEENRMLAMELDQAHGGVFSNLANTFQYKVALWTLEDIGLDFEGSDIEVTIITGIDAIGRQAEAEQAVYLVRDLAEWQNVPEDVRDWIKFDQWVAFVSAGRNVDIKSVIRNQEEYMQYMQEKLQAQQGAQQGSMQGPLQGNPNQPTQTP